MKLLVVRRGLSPEYYRFLRIYAGANRIQLVVDRREGERRRRTHEERRRVDRRTPRKRADRDVLFVSDDEI